MSCSSYENYRKVNSLVKQTYSPKTANNTMIQMSCELSRSAFSFVKHILCICDINPFSLSLKLLTDELIQDYFYSFLELCSVPAAVMD